MPKKFVALFLSILLLCIFVSPNPAVAEEEPIEYIAEPKDYEIRPMWDYIMTFSNAFDISKWGKATADCTISSFNADELSVEIRLQQYKDNTWITIKTWTNREPAPYCGVGGQWYVMSGYYYRIYTIGKAYKNGVVVEKTTYVSPSKKY